MSLRREMKNVMKKFSDIEVKVRAATCNEPWAPLNSLLSEIADGTYNVQAFCKIMQLLWKRINEKGKNWRHVYKSLVVLDYIIKTGSYHVAKQCRENIFILKTLEDFHFIDKDGKDRGINIREKSKQLVSLLNDEERLKIERERAMEAKERIYKTGGVGSSNFPKNKKFLTSPKHSETESVDDSNSPSGSQSDIDQSSDSNSADEAIDSEIENVRPSNKSEENMQLEIALAMSREESENPEGEITDNKASLNTTTLSNMAAQEEQKTLMDLGDATLPDSTESIFYPSRSESPHSVEELTTSISTQQTVDPWGVPASSPPQDPVATEVKTQNILNDHFVFAYHSGGNINFFDTTYINTKQNMPNNSNFLDIGAHLIDFDNIISNSDEESKQNSNPFKPFNDTNPFFQEKPKAKSINEMRLDQRTFGNDTLAYSLVL